MKQNEPVITFDHIEDEKNRPVMIHKFKRINFFELSMFLAEEALAIILFFSMFFLL